MPVRKRRIVAVGALIAVIAIAGALFAHERPDRKVRAALAFAGEPATARCQGSIVELDFDPEGRIEARSGGQTVASADLVSRELSYDACAKAPTQHGWSQRGVHYTMVKDRTTVTCRFPGRFFVHAESVSASWSGDAPAGSGVSLVLGRRVGPGPGPQKTILAAATVLERSDESNVVFVHRYCTTS
jgi:hypothetical protein